MIRIINADVMAGLGHLEDESVQCVCTSPPYWGLRDYGVAGQIGLEPTPDLYVAKMVEVFREVRRVLRKDGTLFLNLGDSYASGAKGSGGTGKSGLMRDGRDEQSRLRTAELSISHQKFETRTFDLNASGLKPKDLVGIPWMTAFALRADGWWLRQEIIWAKPNPMPESVTDRCTKAHEHIFLLTKSARYFYDAEAIKEESVTDDPRRPYGSPGANTLDPRGVQGMGKLRPPANRKKGEFGGKTANADHPAFRAFTETRNKRSVWTIATQPYDGAHFAVFPEEIPATCIKAGSKLGDTILDPFSGAGTTGLVADKLGRDAILIELNPEYAAMSASRIKGDCPMFASVEVTP